ncbi:DUF664 domain-containing protein [Modestobacter sp. NPDC049651]|uniref:mycothiol transferase n=1 Tax=unclassified Modestobacter TaxID=2643866 RepID=UPI0033DF1A7B
MTDAPPWEPPFAGSEAEHLLGSLDRLRATFRWKADGLDAAGLRVRIGASTMTLGGLLTHLAAVEELYSTHRLSGARIGGGWDPSRWDTAEGWRETFAGEGTPAELYARWDDAVARSRARFSAALADGGLDQLVHTGWPGGQRISLRRLLHDLVEEYGRHTGHADLIREAVDGRVGEDPPDDWRPHV